MPETIKYSAETIIHMECGEYSDSRTAGLLVCLKDLDLEALAAQWFEEHARSLAQESRGNDEVWVWVSEQEFVGWLCANQFCAGLNHQGLHIGSYGELEFGSIWYTQSDFEDRIRRINSTDEGRNNG
jgi:hypothetical protein